MSAKLTFGQINNGDFEVWDTTYTNVYSSDLANLFAVPNPVGGIVNSWTPGSEFGVSRTTDSYSGNYSLILHNWYSYFSGNVSYNDSISLRPQYLQGYFKYITGGADGLAQGTATLTLTRFNGASNDTIGQGTYLFDSTVYFTPFQLNINYTSALNPDSINIFIVSAGQNQDCGTNVICNLLYLDDLTLTNVPLSVENLNSNESVVSVFPNPFSTQTTLQTDNHFKNANLTVYNSYGQQVKQIKNISGQTLTLNRDNLTSGLYFLRLTQDNKIISTEKLVITD